MPVGVDVAVDGHRGDAAGVSSATLDGTYSPRYLALQRRASGLRQQLTVPNSVVRSCQTIRQFTGQGGEQVGGSVVVGRGAAVFGAQQQGRCIAVRLVR